jgi:hypothetical protein
VWRKLCMTKSARLSQAKLTPEERSARMKKPSKVAHKSMTRGERINRARQAVEARWRKHYERERAKLKAAEEKQSKQSVKKKTPE